MKKFYATGLCMVVLLGNPVAASIQSDLKQAKTEARLKKVQIKKEHKIAKLEAKAELRSNKMELRETKKKALGRDGASAKEKLPSVKPKKGKKIERVKKNKKTP